MSPYCSLQSTCSRPLIRKSGAARVLQNLENMNQQNQATGAGTRIDHVGASSRPERRGNSYYGQRFGRSNRKVDKIDPQGCKITSQRLLRNYANEG
jgi:hypothetical protein